MAKKSAIEKNKRRERMVKKFAAKRAALKAVANDQALPIEEQFALLEPGARRELAGRVDLGRAQARDHLLATARGARS